MGTLITKLFLMSGSDLRLTDSVVIKHPTVPDILALNNGFLCEDYYWSFVSLLLSDPYDNMVYLDDQGLDWERVTPLSVFAMRWADAKQASVGKNSEKHEIEWMHQALAFYFGHRRFEVVISSGYPYLIDLDDRSWVINEELFAIVSEFITKMNCIEHTDRIKPGSAFAKQALIEDMRKEQKKRARKKDKEQKPDHIGDALATVFSGGAGAITPDNYATTHIYQLITAAKAIQKQMVVQSMLNGIYTGMLKSDKLSDDDLRWV